MLKTAFFITLMSIAYLSYLVWSVSEQTLLKNKEQRPNVVLFTVDTLRADHLSTYGYHRETSPNLSLFSKDAMTFDNAYSVSTYSAPAHASILTGLYPIQLAMNNNESKIAHTVTTLAEILKKEGFDTGGFVGDSVLSDESNFDQGFNRFSLDAIHSDTTVSMSQNWAERGWKKAQLWLEKRSRNKEIDSTNVKPFFLWFHANHPHGNYSPPPKYRNLFIEPAPDEVLKLQKDPNFSLDSFFRKKIVTGKLDQNLIDWVVSQYDGEIAYSDYLFGQLVDLLKSMDEYDNTLIVFVADHGEILFQNLRPGKIRSAGHHANLYYHSTLKIPLLIKPAISSKIKIGQRNAQLISSLDIFSTLLDLLQIKPNPRLKENQSRSFLPSMAKTNQPHRSEVFFGGKAYGNLCSGLINKHWQIVNCKMGQQNKTTLFDLNADLMHQEDVSKNNPEQIKKLKTHLEQWQNQVRSLRNKTIDKNTLSDKMRKHLQKSGYLENRENL